MFELDYGFLTLLSSTDREAWRQDKIKTMHAWKGVTCSHFMQFTHDVE